jgi:hypothetical protein
VLANFFAQILVNFQRPSSVFGKLNLLASYFWLIELCLSPCYRLAPGQLPTWLDPYCGNEVTCILILPSHITCWMIKHMLEELTSFNITCQKNISCLYIWLTQMLSYCATCRKNLDIINTLFKLCWHCRLQSWSVTNIFFLIFRNLKIEIYKTTRQFFICWTVVTSFEEMWFFPIVISLKEKCSTLTQTQLKTLKWQHNSQIAC